MKGKAALVYFSGTGNTKIITELLSTEFVKSEYLVDLFRAEDIIKDKRIFNAVDYDIIGFGFPVHAFGLPRIFHNLIKKLPSVINKKVFVFKTMGDPFINGGANSTIRNILAKKGYRVYYETEYVMNANLAVSYEPELIKELYEFAVEKVKKETEEILSYQERLYKSSFLSVIFSKLVNSSAMLGCIMLGKFHLKADEKCTLCGICIKECPCKNISINKGKIKFGADCTFCTRCFYICPQNAVTIKCFPFLKSKNFIMTDRVIGDKTVNGRYFEGETKDKFKGIRKYLNNI